MALTATPSNPSITHRDGVRTQGQVYVGTTLAVAGAAEIQGALTLNTTLAVGTTSTFTGVATFTAAPVIPAGSSQNGVIVLKPVRVWRGNGTPASIATAGAGSPSAANLITGTVVRDCTGASRVDTLPTAALMVAALTAAFGVAPAVGDSLDFLYINGSDPVTEIITIAEGSGGSWDTNQTAVSRTILGTCSKLIRMLFTNVTGASETYTLFG